MSAPKGDWEIDLSAAICAVLVVAGFVALWVYLACG